MNMRLCEFFWFLHSTRPEREQAKPIVAHRRKKGDRPKTPSYNAYRQIHDRKADNM
ncbi:MAG: hypothetical protein AAF327_11480 [Cyanobacteria bacterium P01_A01_bin.37]